MRPICSQHPADLTRTLQGLVQDGLLVRTGRTSGTTYQLPDGLEAEEVPEGIGESPSKDGEPRPKDGEFPGKSGELTAQLRGDEEQADLFLGAWNSKQALSLRRIDAIVDLDLDTAIKIDQIASRVKSKGKISLNTYRGVISGICHGHFLTIKVIAEILKRNQSYLRDKVLNPLVEEGVLVRAYPQKPNDPRQAYTAATSYHQEATRDDTLPKQSHRAPD
jgi:hypothetical protein